MLACASHQHRLTPAEQYVAVVNRKGWNAPPTVAFRKGAQQVPQLPPDFLSGLVVSVNLMRLSSKKAAYVVLEQRKSRSIDGMTKGGAVTFMGEPLYWEKWKKERNRNQDKFL